MDAHRPKTMEWREPRDESITMHIEHRMPNLGLQPKLG